MSTCIHPVGDIAGIAVTAADWNQKILAFIAKVDDFNIRGQRDQIAHPGFVAEYKFCPYCGGAIDRLGLALMTYAEAFDQYHTSKPKA
jgi:hypothetical protein